jgi:alkylmercury lyase
MNTKINPQQYDHEQLAERLVAVYSGVPVAADSGVPGEEFMRLAPYLWRELVATGQPVEPERLAALAGMPREQAVAVLRAAGAEWDPRSERLVGHGVTLRQTQHRYDTGGRTVWTWCAADLLELPVVFGEPARIQSPCAVTGDPVRVEVAPTSVQDVEPASAVASIVMRAPDSVRAVRQAVCSQQNFYRDAEVAAGWLAANPDGLVLPMADAFEVLRRTFRRLLPAEFVS